MNSQNIYVIEFHLITEISSYLFLKKKINEQISPCTIFSHVVMNVRASYSAPLSSIINSTTVNYDNDYEDQ